MSWPLGSYGSSAAASLLSRSKVRAGAKNLTLDRTLASLMKLCIAVQKCCGTSSSQCGSTGNIPWTPLQLCRSWRQPSTQLRAFLTASRNWRSSRKTLQRYATRLKPLQAAVLAVWIPHHLISLSLSLYLDFTLRIYLVLKSYWGPGKILSWTWWASSCAIMTGATT